MKTIRYDLTTAVEMTKDEVLLLMDSAVSHYDTECKLAASKSGWLSKMRDRYTDHDITIHSLSVHQLQVLNKIAEPVPSLSRMVSELLRAALSAQYYAFMTTDNYKQMLSDLSPAALRAESTRAATALLEVVDCIEDASRKSSVSVQ